MNVGVVGVFIAPTTKSGRWEAVCSMAHRTARCPLPRHHCRWILTVGASDIWATGQSGDAPDSHCSLSGAPSDAALTLRELSAYCSRCRRPLESTVALGSHCSAGTPDSPVNYSGAALQKPEGEEFSLYGPWCTGHCPVRQTRALFGFFCSFLLNPNLDLFIGLC